MTTIQITLPDQLAQEAQRAGLLSQATMEKLLRAQLQAQRMDEFFVVMDRMAQVEPPAMSPEVVAEEIRAMRAAKADLLVTGGSATALSGRASGCEDRGHCRGAASTGG